MGYMCMVDMPVGSCAPYLACAAIASSAISLKKSARQYHCSPAGSSGSNALCSTLNGIGCRPTHIGAEQVVDGEAETARQVADTAAERQAGHPGVGQEAGGGGHAEGHGCVVDVSPGASGVDADGVVLRAYRGAAEQRQVDDQGAV